MTESAHPIIRVFPRRTSMTPRDEMAFVGEPPLWRPEAEEVHLSVTFTWDIADGRRLAGAWGQYYPVVKLGGPAIGPDDGEFRPGMYLQRGVTITSRGCPRSCPWCFVPEREGKIRLLPIREGWILQDNNILACSRAHQKAVFAMLREQGRKVTFSGGLDSRLFTDWTAKELATIPISQVFFAADTRESLGPLRDAVRRVPFLTRRQLRCYVMIGLEESLAQAEERLRAVWRIGCLPFSQLYRDFDGGPKYGRGWRALNRTWSRPAAMFAEMRKP